MTESLILTAIIAQALLLSFAPIHLWLQGAIIALLIIELIVATIAKIRGLDKASFFLFLLAITVSLVIGA